MGYVEAIDKYTPTGDMHSFDLVDRLATTYKVRILRPFVRQISNNQLYPRRFLDLACGKGLVADYVESETDLEVTRSDISQIALQMTVGWRVRALASQLPFADDSFSAIHMKDALVHIEDKITLLRELHRVLVPGGRVLLASQERITPLKKPDEPPYFSTTEPQVAATASVVGFNIENRRFWRPNEEEQEWHRIPTFRFVLNLIKKV